MLSFSTLANPKQAILISSKFKDKDNIMTACWHMPVSYNPPLYAISISKARFSYSLISKSKCFTINFMPFILLDSVMKAGSMSGKDKDKFKESGLSKENCDKIECVRVKEACAYIECKVVNEIEAGDHAIIIGEVVNSKLVSEEKRPLQTSDNDFGTTKD